MTDLKRIAAKEDDVTYLWVRSRRNDKKKRPSPKPSSASRPDPLSFPWGDIVETPLRVLRRMFTRD